jgi:predicted transcriptional regulator
MTNVTTKINQIVTKVNDDKKLTIEQKVNQVVNDETLSKCCKIRILNKLGLTRSEIGKQIGIRYQFVYNVLKNSNELIIE